MSDAIRAQGLIGWGDDLMALRLVSIGSFHALLCRDWVDE